MMSSAYLDMLDGLLRPGIGRLSEQFVDLQVRFVTGRQQPDGGFAGRRGRSDPYYTDFALRTLAWLVPDHVSFEGAADYLAHLASPVRDTVECFNILNARRLLEGQFTGATNGSAVDNLIHGLELGGRAEWALDASLYREWLHKCLLPGGGFGRSSNDERVSAYHTFLGVLCFQMLGVDVPKRGDAIEMIETLRRPDGGYAELAGQTASQTNATAAAVAFLMMQGVLPPEKVAATVQFLADMQSADGGLKAHAACQGGDLLSTFTGLVTLFSLGGLSQIDLRGVARFLQSTAQGSGGFLACYGDDLPDVEYTYYGVGTIAVLQLLTPAEIQGG
jgi:geranylgeranyl transferase type-2 subunit beta